ncbi:hypothetical protein [Nocardia sp. CC201C]|uniref:hypothetical protein n=1 Tax=Nocardia sp. CC201C TaxID=3044575 RepID=UPI0024A9EBE4|nr:hypothetical protein [Nocardia sp. CC201C]
MTDFDNIELVWPAKHHNLKAAPTNYSNFSDIGWQRRRGLYGRIYGFRRAAEILHEKLMANRSVRDLDTVVFPYATCWRHHIELQLKSLLAQLRALSDLPPEARHHHKIDQLWADTKKLALEHFPDEKTDIAKVSKVIGQLAQFDPDGQEFRYSHRRDGSETLPGIGRINLETFHEAMLGVANYLDATDTAVSETLSMQQEIDAYYDAEFDGWDGF